MGVPLSQRVPIVRASCCPSTQRVPIVRASLCRSLLQRVPIVRASLCQSQRVPIVRASLPTSLPKRADSTRLVTNLSTLREASREACTLLHPSGRLVGKHVPYVPSGRLVGRHIHSVPPSGRLVGRHIHPYTHPQGSIWEVYTPLYTLGEAYMRGIPRYTPSGRHI